MDYLEEIGEYNTRKANPAPRKTALLVIDMQNYFAALAEPIRVNVRSLVELGRRIGIPVIYTRHGHHDIDEDGGMLASWWNGDLIMYGSEDWRLMDDIAPGKDGTVIDKMRYSAFYNTGLEDMLRSRGIEDVVITGVMTNCCCETTARDAFMRDFRVFFASDATATANDDLHVCTLKNLAFAFAYVMSTEELLRSLA